MNNLNPLFESSWGFELGRVGRGIEGWAARNGRGAMKAAEASAAADILRKMEEARIYEGVVKGLKEKFGGKVPLSSEEIWSIVKKQMQSIF